MKFRTRGFVSLLLALTFLVASFSGVILYLTPRGRVANWTGWTMLGLDKHEWGAIHINACLLVLVIAVSIGLNHFGIQITILAGILVLGALVIGLGARDVIADAISGLIILMDQPFRVGDIIATEELGTWGKVIDIGTRTTRILTRDKRMAIVPNSRIGARQVINYTFPEPNYRVYSEIPVAYGSDLDRVRRVVHDAVRGIDGILPDQPVDVLFLEYGVSARVMRVRWWINDMYRERPIIAQVNEALEIAFPFRLIRYALRHGSGGAGQHKGGDGIVREYELLAPATVTMLSERRTAAPWGLAGGGARPDLGPRTGSRARHRAGHRAGPRLRHPASCAVPPRTKTAW